MQYFQIVNQTRQQVLADQTRKAEDFFARLRGLLFSSALKIGQGLLIVPCNSIHCMGMSYPIDAIFLDKELKAVGLVENLKPWQMSTIYWQAHSCLELPAGTIHKSATSLGDQLIIEAALSPTKEG